MNKQFADGYKQLVIVFLVLPLMLATGSVLAGDKGSSAEKGDKKSAAYEFRQAAMKYDKKAKMFREKARIYDRLAAIKRRAAKLAEAGKWEKISWDEYKALKKQLSMLHKKYK